MKNKCPELENDQSPQNNPSQAPHAPRVGYGQPPIAHRFQKGKSGNPRGRPPKKERSLTRRQLRRDVLKVGETPTAIRTETGTAIVTTIEAVLMRVRNKALAGHGPSIRLLVDLYFEAVAEHNDVHDEKFSMLEMDERLLTFDIGADQNDPEVAEYRKKLLKHVNARRKLTRKV